ncbi:kynureninase/PvdN C-terminal domain-containing protein, partial [Streptomyces durbertensis]|uniref:kynureninase/PvdN C-terminal domain-containing protein n=1 Tax=Streptomyces durbertensis TaxID=2448886 RepID=UPI003F6A0AD1
PDRLAHVVAHEWGSMRIRSWTESGWWEAPERIGDRIAPLVGAVRAKSLALTDFFLHCVERYTPPGRLQCVTPLDHHRRGSQ